METVQKEAQNVLVMMDINTLKRKTYVLVRMMPCIIIRKNTEIRDLKHFVLLGYPSKFLGFFLCFVFGNSRSLFDSIKFDV